MRRVHIAPDLVAPIWRRHAAAWANFAGEAATPQDALTAWMNRCRKADIETLMDADNPMIAARLAGRDDPTADGLDEWLRSRRVPVFFASLIDAAKTNPYAFDAAERIAHDNSDETGTLASVVREWDRLAFREIPRPKRRGFPQCAEAIAKWRLECVLVLTARDLVQRGMKLHRKAENGPEDSAIDSARFAHARAEGADPIPYNTAKDQYRKANKNKWLAPVDFVLRTP